MTPSDPVPPRDAHTPNGSVPPNGPVPPPRSERSPWARPEPGTEPPRTRGRHAQPPDYPPPDYAASAGSRPPAHAQPPDYSRPPAGYGPPRQTEPTVRSETPTWPGTSSWPASSWQVTPPEAPERPRSRPRGSMVPLQPTAPTGEPNVVCRNVMRSYRISADDTVPALKGVDLDLHPGTVTALIGPSGSGKSTLLRLLACVDRPDSGSILIQGRNTARLSRARRVKLRRRRLGYMFQNPADNLLDYLTVRQHLRLAAQMRGVSVRHGEAEELLERLGLASRANNLPRQLSGGEQQRAAIAFAAIGPPALLVADEPTGQLDHDTVGDVLEAFTALARTGVAIVAATHDPIVAQHADRVVHMVDGRIIDGSGDAGPREAIR